MKTVTSFRDQIPEVLQPAKLVEMYEEFVTKNASSVGQVESALRSLTYIIPGKYALTCVVTCCILLFVLILYYRSV